MSCLITPNAHPHDRASERVSAAMSEGGFRQELTHRLGIAPGRCRAPQTEHASEICFGLIQMPRSAALSSGHGAATLQP